MARHGWRLSSASFAATWRRVAWRASAFASIFRASAGRPPALVVQLQVQPRAASSGVRVRRSVWYRSLRERLGDAYREQPARHAPRRGMLLARIARGPLRRAKILGELEALHRALGGRAIRWPSVSGAGAASACHAIAAAAGPWRLEGMSWSRASGGALQAVIGVNGGRRGTFHALLFFSPPPRSAPFSAIARRLERAGYRQVASVHPPGRDVHFTLGPQPLSLAKLRREVARLARIVGARVR
jgi:hypothetical protein